MHSLSAQHSQPHCANPKMARTWSHMSSAALGPGNVGTPSELEISETVETVRTHQNRSEPIKTHQNPELQTFETAATFLTLEPIETRNLRNLQSRGNFPNLRNAISGTWNLRKTSPIESWNQFPEPVPEPWDPGTQEPVRTHRTWNRFPEPGSFQEPPQLAQNTPKSILCKDPKAFCCWGKNSDSGFPLYWLFKRDP